ncbi:MAG TPA: LysM peptidoglycan-binding domain-containing protein [Chloroflexota bacterium]|nr:LysM peptidoglycan-binding domain-containing protein [Chloroflexota bacterium]
MPSVVRPSVAFASSALSLALTLAPLSSPVHAEDAPAGGAHVVLAGETLSQIAADANVDPAVLLKLNGLDDPNLLLAGQSLKLPTTAGADICCAHTSLPSPAAAPNASRPTAPAAVPSRTTPRTYSIAEGDTLWSIAQQFSTTTAALVDANQLDDPDRLVAGTSLQVPGSGQTPAVPAAAPADASALPTGAAKRAPAPSTSVTAKKRTLLVTYTVQPGETLTQIARQLQVTADVIAQASGLDDPNRIAVGSVLKVPLPGHEHVVQAGETLRDIALSEKVDLGTLIDFNELEDPELIRIGQVVVVPAQPGQQAAAAPATPSPAATERGAAAAPAAASATQPAPAAVSAPQPAPSTANPAAAPATPTPPPTTTKPAAAPTKPAAPIAVVAPPKGSPTDGLAGAGLKLLGAPYVWGGSSPSGFDCSGFLWYVAKQVGKPLSRGMFGEYNSGSHPSREELKPGDLVFFQNTYSPGLSHNGIYIGNDQFVHAADETAGVTISKLTTAYWSSHWFGATRLP